MGTGPCTWNGNGINLICASHEDGQATTGETSTIISKLEDR